MGRVVITGMGVVSPVGSTLDTFWQNLVAGKSGIGPITKFDASALPSQIAGEVKGFNKEDFVTAKEQRRMDDFSIYAIGASKMAVADSGLDLSVEDPTTIGCIVGTGIGGLQTLEEQHSVLLDKGATRCSPFMIPQMISNMAAGLIAIQHGMQGPNYSVVSACASAAHSLGDALRLIQRGDATVMLAGGAEACVCELGIAGFCALRALSTRNSEPLRASRPFDKERDGFVMGDGSAILVLEDYEHARKRNARIYCELSGYGMTCDAYHMTAPREGGAGAARAMTIAMKDAGVNPDGITYINAHGTSTELNDKTETAAMKLAMGDQVRKVAISSTKSMTGHLLGAAAGVESIVCALAIHNGVVPPTINYENPDPDCDLDYVPNVAREMNVEACLNNSLGFGGHNASLVFKKLK
jgi:3-oxoacyl-[acyl-carrier-protein] synthase II